MDLPFSSSSQSCTVVAHSFLLPLSWGFSQLSAVLKYAPTANTILQTWPWLEPIVPSDTLGQTSSRSPYNPQTNRNMQLTLIQGCCKLSWIVILFLCGGRGKKKNAVTIEANTKVVSMPAGPTKQMLWKMQFGACFTEESRKQYQSLCDYFTVPTGADWAGTKGPACIFWSVSHGMLLFARRKQPGLHKRGRVHRTGANSRLAEATAGHLLGIMDTHFGSLTRSLLMKSLARALVLLKYSSSNS